MRSQSLGKLNTKARGAAATKKTRHLGFMSRRELYVSSGNAFIINFEKGLVCLSTSLGADQFRLSVSKSLR